MRGKEGFNMCFLRLNAALLEFWFAAAPALQSAVHGFPQFPQVAVSCGESVAVAVASAREYGGEAAHFSCDDIG